MKNEADEWIEALFIQYNLQNFFMKKQYKYSALCIAYYQQRVNKNTMLRQIVPSTDEIYQ